MLWSQREIHSTPTQFITNANKHGVSLSLRPNGSCRSTWGTRALWPVYQMSQFLDLLMRIMRMFCVERMIVIFVSYVTITIVHMYKIYGSSLPLTNDTRFLEIFTTILYLSLAISQVTFKTFSRCKKYSHLMCD